MNVPAFPFRRGARVERACLLVRPEIAKPPGRHRRHRDDERPAHKSFSQMATAAAARLVAADPMMSDFRSWNSAFTRPT